MKRLKLEKLRDGLPASGGSEFVVEALVDGGSELRVTAEGIYWAQVLAVSKPGLHQGKREPTYVNGKRWIPVWGEPRVERGLDESEILKMRIGSVQNLEFEVVSITVRRGESEIQKRDPVRGVLRGDEFVISISDTQGGSRWYRIRVFPGGRR